MVTAGCSFTAGSTDLNECNINPTVWPHWLAQRIRPKIFNNLAIPGNGNYSIATNLIYYLETKKYIDPSEILIGINITGLNRTDIMCPVKHPDANPYFSWDQEFGYGWITYSEFGVNKPPFGNSLQKNIGYEQLVRINCMAVVQCLSYLELKKFNYFFMVMNNTVLDDSPEWFRKFIDEHSSHWITFDQHLTMHAFTESLGLLEKLHPNKEAHRIMAQKIYDQLVLTKKL